MFLREGGGGNRSASLYQDNVFSFTKDLKVLKKGGGGGGEETRSGTEKRCSHNLQSGHPERWSADNCSIFFSHNFLEARSEPAEGIRNAQKIETKIISCIVLFLAYRICLSVLKLRGKLQRNRVRS